MLIATQTAEEVESISSFMGGLIMQHRWWIVGFVVALIIFNAFRLHINNKMKEEEASPDERLPK